MNLSVAAGMASIASFAAGGSLAATSGWEAPWECLAAIAGLGGAATLLGSGRVILAQYSSRAGFDDEVGSHEGCWCGGPDPSGAGVDETALGEEPDEQPEQDPLPPAGPHARRDLTDLEKTPGSGVLPPVQEDEGNMQPTS